MTNRERRDAQMAYIADEEVFEDIKRARRLTHKLNTMDPSDFEGLMAVAKELLQTEENPILTPPFHCDCGNHIIVGKNFGANYNCCILDVGKVTFGDNCLLAPNVSIFTAGHPLHPESRNSGYEYGMDVTIGDNVWIGGGSIVCPGVTIGSNCVIGAGSVVTKDIPDWSLAAGNPARVIRKISDADKKYLFKKQEFDPEAWAVINEKEE